MLVWWDDSGRREGRYMCGCGGVIGEEGGM